MGIFGIGVYQPVAGSGTQYGQGFPPPTQPPSLPIVPFSGDYGGQYAWYLYTNIRQPQQTIWTPAPQIGLDSAGVAVVRGYPHMQWNYHQFRPDYWYFLKNLYRISAQNPPGYQYLVLIQYPDGNGNPLQQLARWDPPTQSSRDVGAYYGIQLTFSYIGQAQVIPGTPIYVISS